MAERSRRQELILTLISSKPLRTQDDLQKELSHRGLDVTQSTLSRELKALGIAKGPDGRGGYRYIAGAPAGEEPLTAVVALIQSTSRARNLIVVKTRPGNASAVAEGIDRSEWADVVGTVAGDNTILIICEDDRKASRLERRIKILARL